VTGEDFQASPFEEGFRIQDFFLPSIGNESQILS